MEEGYDLAIRIGDLKDSSLIARKLTIFEVAICASQEYLKQYGTPKTPEDLVEHELLGFTSWLYQGGWRSLQGQSNHIRKTPRFESDNSQALLAAALKGIGLIMMNKELLKPEIQVGKLIELMQDYGPPTRPIHAVYPQSRQTTPKLTTFVDFLIKSLKS